jgi:hypothetical protein
VLVRDLQLTQAIFLAQRAVLERLRFDITAAVLDTVASRLLNAGSIPVRGK